MPKSSLLISGKPDTNWYVLYPKKVNHAMAGLVGTAAAAQSQGLVGASIGFVVGGPVGAIIGYVVASGAVGTGMSLVLDAAGTTHYTR